MILRYERRTHAPTRLGNLRLRVDDDGAVYVQVNRTEPALGQAWSAELSTEPANRLDDARGRIAAVLDRHGFAALPAHSDADQDGGYEETVTCWQASGTERTVVVESGRVPAFRALVAELFDVLGVTDAG